MYDVYWLAGLLLRCGFADQNTLSPGNVAEKSWYSQWKWWWMGTSWANHKSMWQHFFKALRVKRQKASASTHREGGGLSSYPTPVHHWKRMVNATLGMGHQADQAHCYEFHIIWICSTQYFTILFWDWGRQRIIRIPSDTWIHRSDNLFLKIVIACLFYVLEHIKAKKCDLAVFTKTIFADCQHQQTFICL